MKTLAGYIMGFVSGVVGAVGAVMFLAAAEGKFELRLNDKPVTTETKKETKAKNDKKPIGFAKNWDEMDS